MAGIDVPLSGLVRSKDQSWSYFIRRFDRFGKTGKYPQEDFSQLAGLTRDDKYHSSVEALPGLPLLAA